MQDASQKAAAAQSLAQQKHQEVRDSGQLAHAAQAEAELLRDASGHINHVASAASAARKWQRKVCKCRLHVLLALLAVLVLLAVKALPYWQACQHLPMLSDSRYLGCCLGRACPPMALLIQTMCQAEQVPETAAQFAQLVPLWSRPAGGAFPCLLSRPSARHCRRCSQPD